MMPFLRPTLGCYLLDFTSWGDDSYNDLFSMREVCSTLDTCGDTTPGPQDIPYTNLRHLCERSMAFLLVLFNQIWRKCFLPEA